MSHYLFTISSENVDFGNINPGVAFFQLGFPQSCSNIPIIDNVDPEPDRTFNVIFSPNPSFADIPNVEYQPINITVTILDDDEGMCRMPVLVYLKYCNSVHGLFHVCVCVCVCECVCTYWFQFSIKLCRYR